MPSPKESLWKQKLGFYGLNDERFQEILTRQDGKCAICARTFSDNLKFHIDHDHTCCPKMVNGYSYKATSKERTKACGKCVRGLLCSACNAGLGMFNDNVQRMLSAIRYLQTYQPEIHRLDDISLEMLPEWEALDIP
jgi:hypothetical protein